MRRLDATNLLRFLVAAVVALASFGPQGLYAHSHAVAGDGHHDHHDHDDAAQHDDHDGPGLTSGVAHVHGSWLGLAITLPAADGASASASGLSSSVCPTLSGELGKGLSGPLKERVPWPEVIDPPEPPRLRLLAAHPPESPLLGDRVPHALAGSTLLLRC